jgi:hypothetical protein
LDCGSERLDATPRRPSLCLTIPAVRRRSVDHAVTRTARTCPAAREFIGVAPKRPHAFVRAIISAPDEPTRWWSGTLARRYSAGQEPSYPKERRRASSSSPSRRWVEAVCPRPQGSTISISNPSNRRASVKRLSRPAAVSHSEPFRVMRTHSDRRDPRTPLFDLASRLALNSRFRPTRPAE